MIQRKRLPTRPTYLVPLPARWPYQCWILAVAVTAYGATTSTHAGNWPEFRGPTGQGVSTETEVPVAWSETTNIAWRIDLPGEGWSSPIYWNGRLYLTAAVAIEQEAGRDYRLIAICCDAEDGRTIWSTDVFDRSRGETAKIHSKNSHASPTPIVDGHSLYVHYGTQGTACLDLDGGVKWVRRDLEYNPTHGNGNSPVLVGEILFINCDGSDRQYVVALDRTTGKTVWQRDRPAPTGKKGFSFATPLAIELNGHRQIISPASDRVIAYDPKDGATLWQFDYEGYSVVPRPVFGHGLLYFSTGYDEATLLALRPGDPPTVAWNTRKSAPLTPSALLLGNELYLVSDRGVATCCDARTGEIHWVERLGGGFSASPAAAGGNIYFLNEEGETVVVRAGTEYQEVSRNVLPGRTLASLAIADRSIYLRTDESLYRIQQP